MIDDKIKEALEGVDRRIKEASNQVEAKVAKLGQSKIPVVKMSLVFLAPKIKSKSSLDTHCEKLREELKYLSLGNGLRRVLLSWAPGVSKSGRVPEYKGSYFPGVFLLGAVKK